MKTDFSFGSVLCIALFFVLIGCCSGFSAGFEAGEKSGECQGVCRYLKHDGAVLRADGCVCIDSMEIAP